jgi:hypothetical protein
MYLTNNYNSEQNYFYCRNNCGVKITFSDDVISKNGKLIPIQENGLRHNCPDSPYNRARATAIEKRKTRKEQEFQTINELKDQIANTNRRLSALQLKLVVIEKEGT